MWFPVSCLRFDEKENVSNCIQLKTSVIKGIKNQLLDQFPDIESWLNQIMPKKDPVKIVRWYELSSYFSYSWYLLILCTSIYMLSYLAVILPVAMNTLKSWRWMESYFSSGREKDRSTQPSDCCIDVRLPGFSLCDGKPGKVMEFHSYGNYAYPRSLGNVIEICTKSFFNPVKW